MKILGLSCSPRIQGNTVILINEALKAAQQEGAEVELYSVSGKTIEPCDGCRACWETGECHINDEMQNLYGKMLEANGIIFGTPVYFYSMTGQAKTIIDRTSPLNRPGRNLANKVGGIVVVSWQPRTYRCSERFVFLYRHTPDAPSQFCRCLRRR